MDLKLKVYLRQYGGTLICVPNTPAWVCDTCHSSQFDPESIRRIEMLVGQAGPPPNRYQPSPAQPQGQTQPQGQSQSRKIKRTAEAVSEPVKARPEGKK
jgi:YgiT-type zinc finger domain-containing protein